jgi:hypothetical protein
MAVKCYTGEVFNYMVEHVGKRVANDISNSNAYMPPSTIEEADMMINQYQNKQQHIENLKNKNLLEEIKFKFKEEASKILKKGEKYETVEEGIKVARVSDILEQLKRSQGRFYYNTNDFSAKKGTVLHKYMEAINNKMFNKETVAWKGVEKIVKDELRSHPDFKDEPSAFFEMNKAQFDQLFSATRLLKKGIDDIQKGIDSKGKYEVFTEVQLFDENRNIAGTADLVVVFSDGSAALYDYKSRAFGLKKQLGVQTRTDWMFQLANYSNMLRNVYGVTKMRQARIIPIDVSFSKKDRVTGDYINQIKEGFQNVSVYNEKFTEDYLKAIPYGERTNDENLNTFLKGLENKRAELTGRYNHAKSINEKVKIGRQISALDVTLQSVYLEKDISVSIGRVKQLADYYNKKLPLDEIDGGLSISALKEGHDEIGMYSNLLQSFKYELQKLKKEDLGKYKKIDASIKNINELIVNLQDEIEYKIFEKFNNKLLYSSGQRLSKAGKAFSGIDTINIPVFNEAHKVYTFFKNKAYDESTVMMNSLTEKYDAAVQWGKKNGYSNQDKLLSLFYDDNINLVDEYSAEFWGTFKDLTKRHRSKDGKPLTTSEIKFLTDNFEVDMDAWNSFKEKAETGLKEQLEREEIKGDENFTAQEIHDKSLANMMKYTDPTKLDNFLKGNYKDGGVYFLKPKKNRREWYSDKYKFIEKHKPLKDYHNELLGLVEHFSSIFGHHKIGRNFIPNVHKDIADMIKDGTILNVGENWETFLNKYKYRESDQLMGSFDRSTGEAIKSIPLLFTDDFATSLGDDALAQIENDVAITHERGSEEFNKEVARRKKKLTDDEQRRLKSTNIHRSMMMFISAANEHINMLSAKEMFDGLKIILESPKFEQKLHDRSDKIAYDSMVDDIAVKFGADPELIKMFNTFYDRLIYKRQFNKEIFKIEDYSGNKILQSMSAYASASFVGLHVTLMASNYITARNNFRIISKEGRLFDDANAKKGIKAFGKRDNKFKMLHNFFHASNRDLLAERADEESGVVSKYTRLKTLFLGHVWGDDRVDALITYAMSDNWVMDSDGTIKNPKVHNIIDKDAKKIVDLVKEDKNGKTYIEGLSFDSYNEFRNVIRKAANEIKGMADETQRGAIYATMAGAQMMLLRSWMPGMAQARFKTLQYDLTYRMIDEGRYLIAMSELFKGGLIPALKSFGKLLQNSILFGKYKQGDLNIGVIEQKRKQFLHSLTAQERQDILERYGEDFTIDKFIELHESKMNAFAKELRLYLLWGAAITMAMSRDWDDRADDEDFLTVLSYNSSEIFRRALLELTFWTSPTSAMQIVRSPFALTGVITNATAVAEEFVVETSYLIRGQRDPDRRTFPGYRLMKATPVVNRIDAFYQVFDQYQRPKGTFEKVFWDVFKED